MMSAYEEGYHQAEKDLLGNKHETSWRLDEKLWKGIDILSLLKKRDS